MDREFPFLNPTRRQYLAGTMGAAAATAASPASAWTASDGGAPAATARREYDRLILSNGVVSRTIRLPDATRSTIGTTDFRTVAQRSRYFTGESDPTSSAFWHTILQHGPTGQTSCLFENGCNS